ncbi:hypothetical protein SAMN05192533_11018 [Mesobacillus persicus]|uniref:UGSC-like domain-containing protein n=3 Tax=Mesobacillus persicus TaxID=930146 RepID=A0A1H8ELW8_9BACI|nr:hypothetical protein SAMN05192533_11018 [Mesobacillus persicus]
MSFIVYNPTNSPSIKTKNMAPRNKSLNGSVIGLIDNGKKNSDIVVQGVAEGLKKKHQIKEVIIYKKHSFSHGLSKDDAKMLADKCDFIISGVGD